MRKEVKNLNKNRATGPDGIKAELINIDLPELTKAIHKVIYVWIMEQMPNGKKAPFVPFLGKEIIWNVTTIEISPS